MGKMALANNTTGNNNTASGMYALNGNTTGDYNSAFGYQALNNSQSGLGDIGVGPFAGRNIVQGELNIDIGGWGSADESNTIRIGIAPYHQKTYIAGIYSATGLSGLPVIVTPNGQLGAVVSSERFKTDIATMGANTEKLDQLRPVTFRYKTDVQGTVQYGLVAEEVAKVYPELVIRGENGRIDGVRYDELAPMLLNEVQRDHEHALTQDATIAIQEAKIASLEQQVTKVIDLEHELAEMRAALAALQSKDRVVAQR
jgi:hypothetical protein